MPYSERRNLKIIIILSVIAIVITSYLIYTKYSGVKSFCDFSPEASCDIVNKSPYSEFPANSGIPVSGLGIIAFLLYIIPSSLLLSNFRFSRIIPGLKRNQVHYLMFLWGVFSILFYLYLTYLELYVIYSICTLCVITFIITIIIFLLLAQNVRNIRRKK